MSNRGKGREMIVKVLVENSTSDENFVAEHGLGLFIEEKGKKYLLDAGQSGVFAENAEKMGVNLENTEFAVLSHGHYDHAGGFGAFLEKWPRKKIYAMDSAKEKYYSTSGGSLHEIGIPGNVYPAFAENFCFVGEYMELAKGIYLVPHSTEGLERVGERSGLFKDVGNEIVPDDFRHEVSLVFDTEKGLVIFNSCSHGGLLTILKEVKEQLPGKKVYAFFGGLHMKGSKNGEEICTFSEEEIQKLAEAVKEQGLQKLYTGHCTGKPGYELLEKYLPEHLGKLTTGAVIEI